jgi:porin
MDLKRFIPALMAFIALTMLSATKPPSSHADGEEIDPYTGPSGLLEYLWWDIVPSHRKFKNDLNLPRKERHLTGDPDQYRTKLSDTGITPSITYVTDTVGNPFGGVRQGVTYCDNIGLNIDFDLQKLAGMPGAKINMSGSWRNGTSLSNDYIDNAFNVQQVFGGQTYKLVDLYFQQSLWEDRFNYRLGRIAMGDEFLSSPLYWNYVNNGFDGNPVAIFKNVPGVTAYPNTTWGARVRARPVKEVYVMAGLFNNDPEVSEPKNHGVDFSLKGPAFVIMETGYLRNREKGSGGMPGNFKLGAYYHDGDYDDLYQDSSGNSYALSGNAPQTHHGNWGFYILLDQMIYREGGAGSKQGLTPFISLLFAPDKDINQMPFFMNGGLVYQGIVPGRDRDIASFGFIYGGFSDDLERYQKDAGVGVQRYELVLELNYNIEIARWLHFIPDIQYVINPGGTGDISDALVLGFQLAFNL